MIPFSPPKIDQRIIDEVNDALRSGWITTGPKTKLFEKNLIEYTGSKQVLCVNSATAGLELMLRWFGLQPGDEVIIPAYTYCATANVVIHCGATPVMADIGDNFNVSLEAIERLITPNTKAIMPVDIGGFPCDYEALNALVNRGDIKAKFTPNNEKQEQLGRMLILSDAAHSIGATYNGQRTGSVTDLAVFSFHAVKNLTTAEGGAIALNLPEPFDNRAIYEHLCITSLHGQSKDALAKSKKGGWRYDVIEAGYKFNMTDLQAAMGLVELARYDEETLTRRKHIFDSYTEAFSAHDWAYLPIYETENKCSSYHLYLLRVKGATEQQRDQIIQEIFDQEVSVNVHYQPLPMLSYYKNLGYKMEDYPQALATYQNEISLPVFYNLSDAEIQTVINAVVTAVDKVMG